MTYELADELNGTETTFWLLPVEELDRPISELRDIQNFLRTHSSNQYGYKSSIFTSRSTFEILITHPHILCFLTQKPESFEFSDCVSLLAVIISFTHLMIAHDLPTFKRDDSLGHGWFKWVGLKRKY